MLIEEAKTRKINMSVLVSKLFYTLKGETTLYGMSFYTKRQLSLNSFVINTTVFAQISVFSNSVCVFVFVFVKGYGPLFETH